MKSFISNSGSFFQLIDLFGVPAALVFGNSTVYRSKFSGFVSFWVYIFLIIMIGIELQKTFKKEYAIVKSLTIQQGIPDEIKLQRYSIFPAFRLNEANYSTYQLMKIEIEYVQRIFFSNGTQNQNITKIPIEPCTLEHFIDKQNSRYNEDINEVESDLLKSNITDWLCPVKNTSVIISGTYGKEYFNYLKIKFLACINQSYYSNPSNQFNPKCISSQTEFDKIYNKGKIIQIEFLHINYLITPDEVNRPSKMFVDTTMYYRFNPRMQKVQSDFFFRKYFITDYDNFFKPENYKSSLYTMRDNFDSREQVAYSSEKQVNNSQEVATFYIRRSPFTHNAKRNFTDLSTLMSFVGGLISCIITLGDLLMGYYNRISYLKTIVNNCYNFADQESYEQTIKQVDLVSKNNFEYFNNIQINSIETKTIKQATFWAQMTHNFKIKLPIPILFIFQCIKKLGVRKKGRVYYTHYIVYQIGMEMIKQDFNCLRIIKSIHQIEKIKQIFLNDQQKNIFNKLSNPLVIINSSKYNQSNEKFVYFKTSGNTKIIPDYFCEMFNDLKNNFLSQVCSQQKKNLSEIEIQSDLYKMICNLLEKKQDPENNFFEFQVSKKLLKLIDQKQLKYFNVHDENKKLIEKDGISSQNEFIYPIISEMVIENELYNLDLQDSFLQKQTTKITSPEQLLTTIQSLNMILVGNGILLKNEYIEISFFKTKDISKQQMLFKIIIKSNKSQIENIEITKRSSKILDIAINKIQTPFSSNFEFNEFQIYLNLHLKSIYSKLCIMNKQDIIDWLIKNKLTIEILIIQSNSQQLIQIPFFNITEQFFNSENGNICDTFERILKKKKISLKYFGSKNEEIQIDFTPPSRIEVRPLQVDKQTQIIIRFFICIIKEQFNKV